MFKKLFDMFGRDIKLIAFAFRNAGPDLARNGTDLSFQITNAGLTRIVADDPLQSLVSEADFFRAQTILANLARDQISFCDGNLFVIGVTRKPNDFHPVKQWTWDRFRCVRSGNEEDLR